MSFTVFNYRDCKLLKPGATRLDNQISFFGEENIPSLCSRLHSYIIGSEEVYGKQKEIKRIVFVLSERLERWIDNESEFDEIVKQMISQVLLEYENSDLKSEIK